MNLSSTTAGGVRSTQARLVGSDKSKRRHRRRHNVTGVAFLVPALMVLLIFRVWPTVEMFLLSLQEWNGFSDPTWIGMENFERVWQDPNFWQALRNNLVVVAAAPIWILFPLLIAFALHGRIKGWSVFRFLFVLPIVISEVFIGLDFKILLSYDGPVNSFLRSVGLDFLAREWLVSSSTALVALIVLAIWGTFGIGMLIFWAALDGTDPDTSDAAMVDGASPWQIHWYITVPAIRPAVEFWSVIVIILAFTRLFPLVFTLTGGGPGRSTQILEYNIYESAFQNSEYGYANAIGVILFLLVLLLSMSLLIGFRLRDR